ncbi:MAG: DNA mismatch repair endonuclease MutL [Bacteriovoracaceae bacterium]
MQKIGFLPEHLIDQIKAGEVIERPSNLIKELLENSIDAKSTEIFIHIKNAGMGLVQLEDNGVGIDFEELPMAFTRHATSKLKDYEDLYRLHTFGFRGEALASISSVSRVTCYSKTKNQKGAKIVIHGGHHLEHQLHPLQKEGTSFYIKDLFYNTPARLKFVKSQSSEKKQIQKIVNSFLLCHPKVSFNIRWDEEQIKNYPANNFEKRIRQVWGSKKSDEYDIISFEQEFEAHKIKAFYSPSLGKSNNNKLQYLFVNNRLIEDRRLHSQILKALAPYWGEGQFGHYLFFLDIPTDQIDVNVHPQKTFIKFLKDSVVYSLIVNGIKSSFHKNEIKLHSGQQKNNDESKEVSKGVLKINNKFWLTQKEQRTYLIKSSQIIPHFLQTYYKKNFPLSNEQCLPLLIGQPFEDQTTDQNRLQELKDFGFDFERIDPDHLILRAIPDLGLPLNYTDLGSWAIKNLSISPHEDFIISEPFEGHLLMSLIEEGAEWIKVVNENDLEKLFL